MFTVKMMNFKGLLVIFCLSGFLVGLTTTKGLHKVHCTQEEMQVEIVLPSGDKSGTTSTTPSSHVYLEGLKGYPDVRCQPAINGGLAEFKLSLKDFFECGVTRMVNKITGKTVYYHKIIIEQENSKEIVSVKCITPGPILNSTEMMLFNHTKHGISRRDVLPAGFQEPEDLEIITDYTQRAPDPKLEVSVRQGGNPIAGDLHVSPGTPLSMEIYLDDKSAPVYGLGVTHMQVTDTKSQEETIIFNGCSVDPYLFENFKTVDGDFLNAKFRAFKFPESTYVQFRAVVNVCLDKCSGTTCSNGQIGYGRRKREIKNALTDPNKIYEVSVATFIKVDEVESLNKEEVLQLEEKLRQLSLANQRLARNSRGSTLASASDNIANSMDRMQQLDTATVVEEESLLKFATTTKGSATPIQPQLLCLLLLPLLKLFLL